MLSDPALEAILKEWNPDEYDPPNTDIQEWTHTIESLCDTYGIPDSQRPQCAVKFVKGDLSIELQKVLEDARTKFGPIQWSQFMNFMIAFDRNFQETWEQLPFYKKHPKYTGAALGITGGVLLAPVAAVAALSAVGFTSGGVAAGSLAATIQAIVYRGAAGGLFALLKSAGATVALPSAGAIFAGTTATTGAGIVAGIAGKSSVPANLLSDSIAHDQHRDRGDGGDDISNPPPPYQAPPQEFRLTPPTIKAIVKAWNIIAYSPPGLPAARWLNRVHSRCERYEVPINQRALCAMHCMRADCREAAHAAGCYDMTWDQFAAWLNNYDDKIRTESNKNIAELLMNQGLNL